MKSDKTHTIEYLSGLGIGFTLLYIMGTQSKVLLGTVLFLIVAAGLVYLQSRINLWNMKKALPELRKRYHCEIRAVKPGLFGVPFSYYLQIKNNEFTLDIRHAVDDGGHHHELYHISLEHPFEVQVGRENIWSRFHARVGWMDDVKIGNQTLDDAYTIKAQTPSRAQVLLLGNTQITNALINWIEDSNFISLHINPMPQAVHSMEEALQQTDTINFFPGIVIDRENHGDKFIRDSVSVIRTIEFAFTIARGITTFKQASSGSL